MRSKNIKFSFEIPVYFDKPDENGVLYTEEAIKNACKDTKDKPLITYENGKSQIIGIVKDVTYNNGSILVSGFTFYGGTEEKVVFDSQNEKIISMEIVGFGIGN